jgi:diguanylate cyclase (GGDEF)-like protein
MAEQDQPWRDLMERYVAPLVSGPPALAFIPAFCLAAFWFGGEGALMVMAAALPIIYLAVASLQIHNLLGQNSKTGLLNNTVFQQKVHSTFSRAKKQNHHSAIFNIAIDDFEAVIDRYGQAAADLVSKRVGEQIIRVLRNEDVIGKQAGARFAVCVSPVQHLDLELCIQLAGRLQAAVEEPVSVDGIVVYVSACVGFCQLVRAPDTTASDWGKAAGTALREAQRRGPSSIRAFTEKMKHETVHRIELREDVMQALELGQIQPWFQPQISTDTGEITGFEALARWSHPHRGIILPAEFLPAIEEAGLLERLAEVMMYHSFAALKAWDSADAAVPQVGVNFAGSELNNPRLIEKIKWELDRFELTPDRLAVEILETVVSNGPIDMITRNINALGKLGCRIDLDDFGTGHTSIASIRRFAVSRIKIDRSFVTKADRDPEQQKMINAILTMAERLGIETLAEGVETVGEHILLAQLGCGHVQGFGIARPMPFEQTLDWIALHSAKLADSPRLMDGKNR